MKIENIPRPMGWRHGEFCCDARLLRIRPHLFAVCRPAKDQPNSVQNDGFTSAGLSGQRRESVSSFELKTVDQNKGLD